MAKSGSTKVIFVPMQLQSDLGGASTSGLSALAQNDSGSNEQNVLGSAGRVGVLSAISDV
jgi:hypothetical protein